MVDNDLNVVKFRVMTNSSVVTFLETPNEVTLPALAQHKIIHTATGEIYLISELGIGQILIQETGPEVQAISKVEKAILDAQDIQVSISKINSDDLNRLDDSERLTCFDDSDEINPLDDLSQLTRLDNSYALTRLDDSD